MKPAARNAPPGGRSGLRRWARRLWLAGLALFLGLLLTHALWLPPLLQYALPRWAAGSGDLHLGLRVRHAHLGRLEVTDLLLRDLRPGAQLELLVLERASVELAPGALLRGDLLGALGALKVRGLELRLDLSQPDTSPRASERAEISLPARLPPIEVEDAALFLRLSESETLAARSLSLAVREDGEGRLAGRDLALERGPQPGLAVERAELRFAYDGRIVRLHSLVADEREYLRPSRIDLTRLAQGEVSGQLELSLLGGSARLEALLGLDLDFEPSALEGSFEARELDLAAIPAGWLPAAWGSPRGRLDLALEARLPLDRPLLAAGELELSGRGLGAAEFELDALAGRVSFGEGRLHSGELRATRGSNRLHLGELGLPLVAADALALLGGIRAQLLLEIPNPEEFAARLAPEVPSELWPRIELEAALADSILEVRRATWDAPGAQVRMGAGRIDLSVPREPELDLDLALRVDALEQAFGSLLPIEASGSLAGIALLRGRWPRISGELHFEGSDLVLGGAALGTLDLRLHARRGALEVRRFLARSDAARIELVGDLALPENGGFDLAALHLSGGVLEVEAFDLARLHAALPAASGTLRLVADGPLSEPRHEIELDLESAAGLGGPALAATALSLRATGLGRRIDVEAVEARGEFGSLFGAAVLQLDPELMPRSLELKQLAARTPAGELDLVAPARMQLEAGVLRIDEFELAGSLGRLRADGHLGSASSAFVLYAAGLDLAPVLGPFLPAEHRPGSLDAELELELEGGRLELLGAGRLRGAQMGSGPPLDLDWDVALEQGRTRVAALLSWSDGALRARADLPLEPLAPEPLGPGELEALFELGGGLAGLEPFLGALDAELAGALDARLELSGTFRALEATLSLDGRLARLRGAGFDLLDEPARLTARLTLGADGAEDRFELSAPGRFEVDARGDLGPALDLVQLRDEGLAALGGRSLERGSVRVLVADAGELVRALEAQGLERQLLRSGHLVFEARAAGTLGEPELQGELLLSEAQLSLGAGLPPLRNVGAVLRGTLEALEVEALHGELGGARVDIQGRAWRAQATAPYELDLELVGRNLLLLRERGIQVRADADLSVKGIPAQGLAIAGQLTLSEGRFARNLDLLAFERDRRPAGARGLELFSLREAPLANLRFDVAVDSRGPFRIENNALRGGLRPALHMRGTGEVPVLTGSIFLDPTRVHLPSGSLRLESGVIRFEPADPFVPRLAIQGGMRLRGYDIQVTLQGPYDAPEVILTSSPPLSDRALLMLVLTGELPPDEEGSAGVASASRSLVVYLARDFLTRWFDDESIDDDESLLDRLEISTGRDVTRQGSETVEASFRIADKLIVPNDSLYLRGERDVYDEFNYGLRLLFRFR